MGKEMGGPTMLSEEIGERFVGELLVGAFRGVCDQLVDDQRDRNRAIGRNSHVALRFDVDGAMPDFIEIAANFLDVEAEVHLVRLVAGMNVTRLELQHARHDGETVLDPVRDLLEQHLLVRQRRLEAAILPLALDRQSRHGVVTEQPSDLVSICNAILERLDVGALGDWQSSRNFAHQRGDPELMGFVIHFFERLAENVGDQVEINADWRDKPKDEFGRLRDW
jgi:hypothetical protein